MTKRKLTFSEAEGLIDRLVMKRLSTDRAYNNAEDAESQADREEEISMQIYDEIHAKYDVEDN